MHIKHRKSFAKILSIILALSFVLLSMPIAFAAQITLSAANITTLPTATGTIYYGQTVSEAITLSGGEVQYNGSVVSGKFVHTDPAFRPLGAGANRTTRTSFTFVPTDSTTYSNIAVRNSRDVTYIVLPTVPILASEDDKPVVTTEVEAGTALSEITISGGKVQNPYYAEESTYLSQTWTWVEPSTPVDKSGYYKAKIAGDDKKYSDFILDVYVEVVGSTIVPEIEKNPLELEFENGRTWSNVNLDCCEAFVSNEDGTTSKISGSFSVTDYWKELGVLVGSHQVDVIFTPDDIETYATVEFKLSIMVKPMPINFIDDEGNVVEDFTFEVEPGVKMNDVKALIQANLRAPKNSVIGVEDNNGYAENGRKYKLTVNHDDSNYEGTELYFTIKFKETEITPTLKWVGEGQLKVDCGDYSPPGSFAVYYVIGETETKIGDVKGNSEILEWTPTSSGDYGFKVEYNPIENDYFIIESVTTTNYSHFPEHKLIATGSLATLSFSMGETATVTAPATDPALLDKPYYGFTGWTDVKGNTGLSEEELANATVSFAMPDGDVELTANYKFSIKLYFEWVWQQIVQFFTFIINAVKDLFALATV